MRWLLLVILLAGCGTPVDPGSSEAPAFWGVEPCQAAPRGTLPEDLPDILAVTDATLRYSWNGAAYEEIVRTERRAQHLATAEGIHLVASTRDAGGATLRLGAYTDALAATKSVELRDVGALAAGDGRLFVARTGIVEARDPVTLEVLDSRTIRGDDGRQLAKSAHHGLVHDGTVYLLDNGVHPVYIFTIDAATMELGAIRRLAGGHGFLSHQWVDGSWFMTDQQSELATQRQQLMAFDEKLDMVQNHTLWQRTFGGGLQEEGLQILDVGSKDWMLLGGDEVYVASVSFDDGPRTGCRVALPDPGDSEWGTMGISWLLQEGEHAVALVGDRLFVIDLNGAPSIVHEQTLAPHFRASFLP